MDVRESASTISLSDLIALNDEMAALVRSGASLEQGLSDLGGEVSGRLGDLATRLGRRLQSGENLASILGDDSLAFPPIWRATVLAGIRSGRLAVVLESLAVTGRRISEMRRSIGAALVYPMIVVMLAYVVFVFLVTYLAPLLAETFLDLTQTSDPIVTWLAWVGLNAVWWVFWPPAALAALLLAEWWQARRGFSSSSGPLTGLVSRIWPTVKRSRHDARLAAFLEILALLIREQVPLPEALLLAANASGDDGIRVSAATLAEKLSRGHVLTSQDVRVLKFPPLLGFMLSTAGNRAGLTAALVEAAGRYRERSLAAAARTTMVLPIIFTSFVGGAVTLLISLGAIWPVWRLILRLGA